jgi:hypothetical protein
MPKGKGIYRNFSVIAPRRTFRNGKDRIYETEADGPCDFPAGDRAGYL